MINENNYTAAVEKLATEKQKVKKRALYTAVAILLTAVVAESTYIFLILQQGVVELIPLAWATGVLIPVIVLTLFLIGRGYIGQSIWLMFAAMCLVVVASSFLVAGIGLFAGAFLILLVPQLASQTLPSKQVTMATIVAGVTAVLAVLLDMFGSDTRVVIPNLANYIAIFGSPILLVYGFIILRQFPNYRMNTKLIAATAFVAILSVVSVTVIVGATTRNALTNQLGDNLNSLAESQALSVGEVMSRQVNVLKTLALNQALTTATGARRNFYDGRSPDEVAAGIEQLDATWRRAEATDRLVLSVLNNSTSQELLTFRQAFPEHVRLYLADSQGGLVAASEQPEQYDFSNEVWWQRAYSGGFAAMHLSQPYLDARTGAIVVDIAVPVQVADNTGGFQVAGVLYSVFNVNALATVLEQASFGDTGHFDLHFDNINGLEVHDGDYEMVAIGSEESRLVEELWVNSLLFAGGVYDGTPSLVSQARVNTLAREPQIDSLGWRVIAVQPETEALQPVQQQQRTNILMGIAIVILAAAAAAFIAQVIARPIVRLTDTAVQVVEGDLSARTAIESQDEIGTLAATFNQMTSQLQASIEGLEQRVAERSRALAASVEVSRSLSTILDPAQLVIEVVEQVRAAFGYYYVQIYLFDEAQDILQMAGGTGEAGQVMLARGHSLPAGQGLVGQAAASNRPVFIPDVFQAPEWKSNPLLPDTKAEITVPIAVGEKVLGVLDVQHDVAGVLAAEAVDTLQSVAYQVAIAIQNARSFDEVKKQAEQEALINSINQKIQNAASVDDVLKIAAEEVGRALGGQKTSTQLFNPVHDYAGNGRRS